VLLENLHFNSSSESVDVLLALLVHIAILGGPIFAGLYYTRQSTGIRDHPSGCSFSSTTSTATCGGGNQIAIAEAHVYQRRKATGAHVHPEASRKDQRGSTRIGCSCWRARRCSQAEYPACSWAAWVGGVIGGVIGGVLNTGAKPIPPPTGKTRTTPWRVGGRVRQPRGIVRTQPAYPTLAREARIQGDVTIDSILDEEGNIVEMKVISGHPFLYQAALSALKKWKYEPTYLNDKPIAVEMIVTVTFQLSQ
jgi:TonB family protein